MQETVEKFIEQYKLAYDHYANLAKITKEQLDEELASAGIKAILSWRAKEPESLQQKLIRRDNDKKYCNVEQIQLDIADLAGVRIALYFPSERTAVDTILKEKYNITLKKVFPEQGSKPTYDKRFSGYWATHYRVMLKPNKENTRYCNQIVEIQVASLLMHSWSEIEHDLLYKPVNGDLTNEEQKILDEINGLVLVGEIALERLRKSMIDRVNKNNKFEDSYDLRYYISKYINDIDTKNIGNINSLNETIKKTEYNSKRKLKQIIESLEYEPGVSIADEIADKIITDTIMNDKDIKRVLQLANKSAKGRTGFECFLKLWKLAENVNEYVVRQLGISKNKYHHNFEIYLEMKILTYEEYNELQDLRRVRNKIANMRNEYEEDQLKIKCESLQRIISKIIDFINDSEVQETFKEEFKNII